MRDQLAQLLTGSGSALALEDIALHVLAAAVLSLAIYLSYWYTHAGTAYSKKFNVSLVTLTVLTATVMTVIGNNIALSLGMVGALSIVRFRTAIKDSRDTTYIFWAIIVGIACGAGDYLVGAVGSAVVFVVLLLFGRVRNENRVLLIIRAAKPRSGDIERLVFEHFNKRALLKVRNTTAESAEFIYEMPRSVWRLNYKRDRDIADALYALEGVEYVNTVTQSDEITGWRPCDVGRGSWSPQRYALSLRPWCSIDWTAEPTTTDTTSTWSSPPRPSWDRAPSTAAPTPAAAATCARICPS